MTKFAKKLLVSAKIYDTKKKLEYILAIYKETVIPEKCWNSTEKMS